MWRRLTFILMNYFALFSFALIIEQNKDKANKKIAVNVSAFVCTQKGAMPVVELVITNPIERTNRHFVYFSIAFHSHREIREQNPHRLPIRWYCVSVHIE